MTTPLTDMFDADNDLLAAFPARPSEIRIGYARVSTGGQNPDRQVDALTLARGQRIFKEKKSGKNGARPELKACHAFLEPGGILVVPSLDRYGRSLQDLVNMVAELRTHGIGFTSLHEKLDTLTPGGRPTVVSEQMLRAARDMLPNPENSIETIAKLLGVSVGTLNNRIPDLKELRTSRVPAQLTGVSR
ncbi:MULTISPECIES: recombinase family protein [unclassified Streptomyces]|uniref:recombinase family protein n=1 Tax=Streptomyces sp. SID5789 TaxID=2690310 RepID=UPI0013718CD7|nr:recombinase family protein [Streptomyces sp. SID5789]MZE69690.1 recombinase family protein [Streptomyces sp. SID5789]